MFPASKKPPGDRMRIPVSIEIKIGHMPFSEAWEALKEEFTVYINKILDPSFVWFMKQITGTKPTETP